ncbi:CAP domain-containing protein [Roseobacteraceae bacterium NS-SX3]
MSQASTLERQMLELINNERTSRGLQPVQLELRLNESSEDHSSWMLAQDVFSHTGAGGSSAGDRMRAAGFDFSGSWTWAENIAWQSERGAPGLADDVTDLHNSLMNSPGHRANILSPNVEVIGIGIEQGNFNGWDAVMVTQNFARTSAPLQLDTGTGGGSGGSGGGTPAATAGDDALALQAAGTLSGLDGDDTLTGSSGQDRLEGNTGQDKLLGGGSSDTLDGGAGNDLLKGGRGRDLLTGGSGNDRLKGNGGADTLSGGSGNDVLAGQKGNDVLTGGAGNDRFVFGPGADTVTDFDAAFELDRIDLRGAAGITGFGDLSANHARDTGAGLLITDDQGSSILLENIALQDLSAGDFLF